MTLLELLVKELPGKGGWPEGHSVAIRVNDNGMLDGVRFHANTVAPLLTLLEDTDFKGLETVTREQYKAALAASQSEYWRGRVMNEDEWNGDGFPPLGCECEWQDKNTKHWIKVRVVYSSEWVTVIREDKIADPAELAIENYGDEARRQFRPIRTEAERRRHEAVEDMRKALGHGAGLIEVISIYRAIERGDVRGVKLEDV